MNFSERKGHKKVSDIIQKEGMSKELRNSIWNVLNYGIFSTDGFMYTQYGQSGLDAFARILWFQYFKEPVDDIPDTPYEVMTKIKHHFFTSKWNEVYDFVEFTISIFPRIITFLNEILEKELSGYRI